MTLNRLNGLTEKLYARAPMEKIVQKKEDFGERRLKVLLLKTYVFKILAGFTRRFARKTIALLALQVSYPRPFPPRPF